MLKGYGFCGKLGARRGRGVGEWGVEAELDESVKTATECHVKLDFILQEKNRRLPNQEMITCS